MDAAARAAASVWNQRIESTAASRAMTPTRAGFSGSQAKGGRPFIARSILPLSGRIVVTAALFTPGTARTRSSNCSTATVRASLAA